MRELQEVDIGRGAVARGAKWSLVSLASKQTARIVFTIILAKILGPANFGIIGQATIYVAFSSVFLDVGLGAALIQRRTLDRAVIGTATAINYGVVALLILATFLTAPFWADFFDTPQLASVLPVLSATFLFNGLTVVPAALLTRRLEFRLLGLAEVVSTLVGGGAGIVAAYNGAEYWSLVIQTLTRDVVYAAIVIRVTGRPVVTWSTEALRSIASFSRNVFGGQLLGFANQNGDNFLIAWRLGPAALGNYTLSYRVLLLPVQILGQTANRLAFPVFSRLQDEPERLARYYLSIVVSLSLIVVPAMVMVALAAPTAVPLVFGSAWDPAIEPMQVLALGSILAALMTINSPVLLARDRADWLFRYSLLNSLVLLVGFAIGVNWGIVGVAWAYLIGGVPMGIVLLGLTSRLIPIGLAAYARATAPAATGAVVMVASWHGATAVLGEHFAAAVGLVLTTALAGATYLGTVLVGWPRVARDQVAFVSSMKEKRRPPPTPR